MHYNKYNNLKLNFTVLYFNIPLHAPLTFTTKCNAAYSYIQINKYSNMSSIVFIWRGWMSYFYQQFTVLAVE